MEWFSLLLRRKGMVCATAMETRNGFHYCYGDNESFSLLLLRRGMVYTTAMDTRNGFHYCYGEKEWFCDIIWYILCFSDYFRHLWNYNENKNHIYCVFRIILDTGLWKYNENKNHMYCSFRIILDTYGIIMKINIIYIVFFGLF